MKNKRGGQIVNGSLSPKFLPQSNIYMGRKISDNYYVKGDISNKRQKANSSGCSCGKAKQVVNKNK